MGHVERDDGSVPERRAFVQRLRAHEGIATVDFTRDGFRWVFVEVESGEGLPEGLRREAERLGYDVETPGADAWQRWRLSEWWDGSHETVRVLRLGADSEPVS